MGMNSFAPFIPGNKGTFIVCNISDPKKTVKIFNYPILHNKTRDLLQIPGISESDIRASLLKGEIRNKILANEIVVESSDVDLLQFNLDQKSFLQNAGIVNGLTVGSGSGMSENQHKTLRQLIHLVDGVGGPMEGFASGAYRETLPSNSAFPTSIIWYESNAKIKKIVEKNISYDIKKRISVTIWKAYDENGVLLATITDTFSYNGNSIFESSRIRAVS